MVMEFRIAGPPAYDNRLKTRLQSAVQSVQWTYSLFWQLCPQKGILVWGEGYYNGAIKTRKTVQPMEVTTEEAALNRSEQLRELYNSLAGGDHHQMIMNHHQQPPTTRRPSAALLPEDLTESEWFYLMCFSFSFAHGVGLVGEAYEKQRHVWLTGADEVDSTVFTRAILAKSAHVQTVACIPVLNGVVELGTTENVEEDFEFVKHVKSLFVMDQNSPILPLDLKPALSAHSSNTTLSPQMSAMIYKSLEPTNTTCQIDEEDLEDKDEEDQEDDDDDEDDDEDDDDEACDGKDEEGENGSDSDADTGHISGVQNPGCVADELYESELVSMPNDLLQLDMPEDIRVGSPNDGSNNLNLGFQFLAVGQACDPSGSIIAESTPRWPDLSLQNQTSLQIHASGAPQVKESTQEDTHYSTTVSTILQNQSSRCSYSYPEGSHHAICSTQSSFSTWTPMHHRNLHRHRVAAEADAQNSQWILKHIVFTVPFLHSNTKSGDGAASDSVASRLRKGTSQDELSANHVLAERRRREKLNERFIILRSLVPVVTKMDKASILGDTIEYLKQLRQKIQDLEARASVTDGSKTVGKVCSNKRKIRVVEGRGGGGGKAKVVEAEVEVSIIESDALVELHCPHNEGLLLDVMKQLREFGIEITTVQSSLHSGTCTAEIRAKVKEKANGNKVSIMQVKKAINQIINSSI